ncbi:MAG: helix-turn-helix domain-containing protein [Anaerolineaceae bacterium]|jgi:DNA-binding IclR family transcriptional regulator/nitroimidazol reductase NimA-like FMN-containing flavoprotein (pyridoxamine 5'-phosphate oxidase superfamily)|nr:helix-turn-helix domain-containing protein [Anaerolineaceae bacterium]
MKKESLPSTIERTLSLLEIFIQHPEGLSPQEILEQTSISRSTLFILLKELKEIGYLAQSETRGRYIAGPRLLAWSGSNSPSYQTLINVFQQEIHNKAFPETLALAVPGPQGILLLDQREGDQIIRAVYSVGEPLAGDSAAHAILTSPYHEQVIQCGYSLEENKDYFEIALPICADGIKPIAGLIFTVPKYRWSQENLLHEWLSELRAMAARISYRLGALQYSPYHQDQLSSFQPTTSMNDSQITQFLLGPWTARLACIRPDGHPHVIPVWQEWDGEKFSILAWHGSQWVDYIRKNPQVSLTVDEPWAPYRRISMRGAAKEALNIDIDTRTTLLSKLSQRYLGQDTPQRFINQVETVFTINPDTLRGWMGLAAEKN